MVRRETMDALSIVEKIVGIIVGLLTIYTAYTAWKGDGLWKKIAIAVLAAVVCVFVGVAIHDLFRPVITETYIGSTVKVTVDSKYWFANVYYSMDGKKYTLYEAPVSVANQNVSLTFQPRLGFLHGGKAVCEINTAPVFKDELTEDGKFSLKITAPEAGSLETALSAMENGFIDFTHTEIDAGGIQGAQFIRGETVQDYPDREGTEENGGPPQESAGASSGSRSLGDLSEGGYLTIRAPLDSEVLDITIQKNDLCQLLADNKTVYIEAFRIGQNLHVNVTKSTSLAGGFDLEHGLLLELYGSFGFNLPAGCYAKVNDQLIPKSVARRQDGEMPSVALEEPPPKPPEDGEFAPDMPKDGPPPEPPGGTERRGEPHSLVIPLEHPKLPAEIEIVVKIAESDNGSTYEGISKNDEDAVAFTSGHNLMIGRSSVDFSPDDPTTEDMFITALYRLEGSPGLSAGEDADVPEKAWEWAQKEGIVKSDNPRERGAFQYELLRMLWRYVYREESQNVLKDEIPSWAVDNGLISNDARNPDGPVTRMQMANILMNYCIADADWKKTVLPNT